MRSVKRLSMAFGEFARGRALLAVLALAVGGSPAAAQETGGSIGGTIADAQSAALPGVTVSLRNEGTNAQLNTVTNIVGN